MTVNELYIYLKECMDRGILKANSQVVVASAVKQIPISPVISTKSFPDDVAKHMNGGPEPETILKIAFVSESFNIR